MHNETVTRTAILTNNITPQRAFSLDRPVGSVILRRFPALPETYNISPSEPFFVMVSIQKHLAAYAFGQFPRMDKQLLTAAAST